MPVRKPVLGAILILAALGAYAVLASSAWATPTKTSPCNGCHGGPSLPITTNLSSVSGSNATYNVSSAGAYALAVFDGSTKVAQIDGAGGSFSVAVGRTYTVFAVAGPTTSSGLGSTSLSPAAPPVAPPADTTAPTTVSDATTSYVSSAAITLTATDVGSGVAATYYMVDGGAQYAGTSIVVTTPGAHTIEFWSVDVAGNAELHKTVAFTITSPVPVDSTPPVTVSNALPTYVSSAAIKLTATDAGSGVAGTYYRLDGGTQTAGTSITVTGLGAHTIEFWSVDAAGNVEAHKTASFRVNAPVPAVTPTPTPVPTPTVTATPTQTSTAATGTATSTVTINIGFRKHHVGARICLEGRLTPAVGGETVQLFAMTPDSPAWTLVSTATTHREGPSDGKHGCKKSASAMWWARYRLTTKGTYSFQVRFAGSPTSTPATSTTICVKAR